MRKTGTLFLLLGAFLAAHAQSHTIREGTGPVIGYRGVGNHFLEVGITKAGATHGIVGFELSYLNNLKADQENISGLSLGYYSGFAIFEVGVNGTFYTNFDAYNLFVRPYLGLGIGGLITLGYGYNFSLGKNTFGDQIARHELRLIARFPIGI